MRNILHVIQLAYVSMLNFDNDPNDFEKGLYVILSKGKGTKYPNTAESCICLQIFAFSSMKKINFIIHFKE